MSENVIDPVRETLKSILDLTGDLVKQLREAGEDQQARSIIVWVATCLHIILVKKQRLYEQNPFSPEIVRKSENCPIMDVEKHGNCQGTKIMNL